MGRHEETGHVPEGEELARPGEHERPQRDVRVTTTISGVLGSPRFWLLPLLLVVVVMSFMAALYMGAIADPEKNLHNFPVAIVNEDSGGSLDNGNGTSTQVDYGKQVADGIITNAAKSGIAVHRTDRVTALNELNGGKVYGVVALGANFSDSVLALGKATVLQARPEPVTIDVYINRGSGTFASAVTTTFADRISEQVNAQMGQQLTDTVRAQLAKADVAFSGAAQLALWQPVKVDVIEATPLPTAPEMVCPPSISRCC